VLIHRGKSQNKAVARKWIRETKAVWEENFHQVGNGGKILLEDGANRYVNANSQKRWIGTHYNIAFISRLICTNGRYIFYASGRDNTFSVYVTLNLLPRHDLITLLWMYANGQKMVDTAV
jgi:Protein of unknown function (DUF1682)